MTLLAVAVNGRGVVAPGEPVVHADDEAFLRGRAAFETVRVYGGRPFRLDAHLTRLGESARRLGLPPADLDELRGLIASALSAAAAAEAMLRFYWTPGREGLGSPSAVVLVRDLPGGLEEQRSLGLRLATIDLGAEGPGLLGGVKSTSYALNMVAVDEAGRRGADDALLLGTGRTVLECSTSNIWWRQGRTLFTPGLETGILAGVTRAALVELAPAARYIVVEGVFRLEELSGADEVFTSSSVREVMPVVSVDGSRTERGAAAGELQAMLREIAEAID